MDNISLLSAPSGGEVTYLRLPVMVTHTITAEACHTYTYTAFMLQPMQLGEGDGMSGHVRRPVDGSAGSWTAAVCPPIDPPTPRSYDRRGAQRWRTAGRRDRGQQPHQSLGEREGGDTGQVESGPTKAISVARIKSGEGKGSQDQKCLPHGDCLKRHLYPVISEIRNDIHMPLNITIYNAPCGATPAGGTNVDQSVGMLVSSRVLENDKSGNKHPYFRE